MSQGKRIDPRRGTVLVWVLVFGSLALAGMIATAQLIGNHQQTQETHDHAIRAKHLAEAGLERSIGILNRVTDPSDMQYYDSAFFGLQSEALTTYFGDSLAPLVNGASGRQSIGLKAPDDGSYQWVSLSKPRPDRYRLRSLGTYTGVTSGRDVSRLYEAELAFQFDEAQFGAVIISDMAPIGPPNSGKKGALNGHVSLDVAGPYYVFGDILTNGEVIAGSHPVDSDSIGDELGVMAGAEVNSGLWGTEDEVPDYTSPGSENQLFDFGRFIAATDAGAGVHYASLNDFVDAANAGTVFEGITVVDVNPATYADVSGGSVKIDKVKLIERASTRVNELSAPRGITALGTLLFNIATEFEINGSTYMTPADYKIFFETDISVNAASPSEVSNYLSEMQTYNDAYQTWLDGDGPQPEALVAPNAYPAYDQPGYDGPRPYQVNIPGYEDFTETDDLPALMYNTGILDLHRGINISGVLYTPSFVEIEQKVSGRLQYVAGSIIGGGGVYIEGRSSSGGTVLAYLPDVMNQLATSGNKLRTLSIVAWRNVSDELGQ